MSDGVAYNPCSACKKDNLCNICELHLYRSDALSVDKWISVDERLPEREGTYLAYTTRRTIEIARFYLYYVNGKPQFDYWITHWMPLPEAPKMKGGAE